MIKIKIIKGDITNICTDAIVNAANNSLLGGGGVDGAIHKASGPGLIKECRLIGGCNTGDAKITKGYNLPAKFVIHTVGPVWKGGSKRESEMLESCYKRSFEIMIKYGLKSIAFPSISTGVYSFPIHKASIIAVNTTLYCLKKYEEIESVTFVLFSINDFEIYKKLKKGIKCEKNKELI